MINGNSKTVIEVVEDLRDEFIAFITTRIEMVEAEFDEKAQAIKMSGPLLAIGMLVLVTGWLLFSGFLVCMIAQAFAPSPWNWALSFLVDRGVLCDRRRRRGIHGMGPAQRKRSEAGAHSARLEAGRFVVTDRGQGENMSEQIPSQLSPDVLEQRAAEQRQRIHNSVDQLKSSLQETVREHLDVENYARTYIWRFVTVAAGIALISGYGVAGMFTRR